MKVRRKLLELAKVIADQAERDPEFARRVGEVLGMEERPSRNKATSATAPTGRPKHRRPPAALDPIAIAREGEDALGSRRNQLSLDQLRDIVADYGMDPGKLVMKWKSSERVIDRIVEISMSRAQKGDAFRAD